MQRTFFNPSAEACAKAVKDLKRGLARECGEGEKVAAYYVAGGDCENLELGSPVDTKNLNALPWWTGGCSEENAQDNNVTSTTLSLC